MNIKTILAALSTLLLLLPASVRAVDLAQCAKGASSMTPLLTEPILVLGEIHGTNEIPELAGAHVCALLLSGRSVLLALEIPAEEQARVNVFLDSSGDAAEVQKLLAGPHWTAPTERQDGRAGRAMLALLELARAVRHSHGKIDVVAIDGWEKDLERDAVMAQNLEHALLKHGGYSTVVLIGNLHAAKFRGSPFDPEFESMVYLLGLPNITSINVVPLSGFSWFCSPECGVHSIGLARKALPTIGLNLSTSDLPTYRGTFYIPKSSASLPAVRQ